MNVIKLIRRISHLFAGPILALALVLSPIGCGDGAGTGKTPPPTECTAGAQLCPCSAGGGCTSGLACEANICRPAGSSVLSVADAAVRACDVLLTLPDATEASSVYEAGSMGAHVQRGSKVGLSFGRRTDSAFGAGAASISSGNGAPRVESTVCYDRAGKALPGATVEVR